MTRHEALKTLMSALLLPDSGPRWLLRAGEVLESRQLSTDKVYMAQAALTQDAAVSEQDPWTQNSKSHRGLSQQKPRCPAKVGILSAALAQELCVPHSGGLSPRRCCFRARRLPTDFKFAQRSFTRKMALAGRNCHVGRRPGADTFVSLAGCHERHFSEYCDSAREIKREADS